MDRLAKNAVIVVCKSCKQPIKPEHVNGQHWISTCCDNVNQFEEIMRFINA